MKRITLMEFWRNTGTYITRARAGEVVHVVPERTGTPFYVVPGGDGPPFYTIPEAADSVRVERRAMAFLHANHRELRDMMERGVIVEIVDARIVSGDNTVCYIMPPLFMECADCGAVLKQARFQHNGELLCGGCYNDRVEEEAER